MSRETIGFTLSSSAKSFSAKIESRVIDSKVNGRRSRAETQDASSVKIEVLRRRSDFLRSFKLGRRIQVNEWLILHAFNRRVRSVRRGSLPEMPGESVVRLGWTVPKGVGPAVQRNKIKRWLRVWLRQRQGSVIGSVEFAELKGWDLNFRLKPMAKGFYRSVSFDQFSSQIERAWLRLVNQERERR